VIPGDACVAATAPPRDVGAGHAPPGGAGTIEDVMADRAALEREMGEIRAQLDWVRDYL
jgi:hypothetical protein